MSGTRRYRLQCPIARALDVVGDRWTLLILRDLHAGPARFQELEAGLGVATNLLATRLTDLVEAGLVTKVGDRHSPYALTDVGRSTDRLLWELAGFGAQLERVDDPRPPGNARVVALPLRMMLESVTTRPDLVVELRIDDDALTVVSSPTAVDVVHGRVERPPDLVLVTSYDSFLDAGDGRLSLDDFMSEHVEVLDGVDQVGVFADLMRSAFGALRPSGAA